MNWLFRYANPHEFMRLSGAVLPFTAIATALVHRGWRFIWVSPRRPITSRARTVTDPVHPCARRHLAP